MNQVTIWILNLQLWFGFRREQQWLVGRYGKKYKSSDGGKYVTMILTLAYDNASMQKCLLAC